MDEIAAVLDCQARTLQRRFVTHMERGRGKMRMSLRRLQMRAAENGNAALLIWLGKQNLGQRDKLDVDHHYDNEIERELARLAATSETQVSGTPEGDTDSGLVN